MRKILLGFLFLTFGLAYPQNVHNGEDVIRAMHDHYQSSWYKTVTFTQKSTTYKPDGTSSFEMWYEAASLPGKLRIDIGTPADNNGYLMVDGNISILKKGALAKTDKYVNILLVLGFDAYTQDPAKTIEVVKEEGYDLSKFHEDTWDGKAAYVVGADKGDLKSKQFWIEKDTLLFVRVIEPARQDPAKVDDIRFVHYQPRAGAWIAAGVEVYSDGKKVFTEDYTDIQANVKLDPGMFDPQKFSSTHWEK
ncbi:MAG: LolA family protein [Candidatus Sulfotelmatobacter sp.]